MKPGRRFVLGAGAGVGLAAGVGVAWWRYALDPAASPTPPEFWQRRFERPEGGELAMADFRRRPLLINFWATWCPPCVRELPEIDRLAHEHAGRGLGAVALAVDGKIPVREFLQRMTLSIPVGLCGLEGSELMRQFGNLQAGLPYTVLLAADGRVLQRKLGETNHAELSMWLKGLSAT